MGLTKQYLRFAPHSVFNVIGSGRGGGVYLRQGVVAVAAVGSVEVWDIRTREKLVTLRPADGPRGPRKLEVCCLACNSGGSLLAAGYTDGTIRLFDTAAGEEEVTFTGHKSAVTALAFHTAGLRLVSGSRDCSVIVWDVVGECGLARLVGHKGPVTAVTILREGGVVVSASKDTTVRFWELSTQHCFKTVTGHLSEVWGLALVNDERQLVTGSTDSELRVWGLRWRGEGGGGKEGGKRIKTEGEGGTEEEDSDSSQLEVTRLGSVLRKGEGRVAGLVADPGARILACHGTDNTLEMFVICTEEEVAKRLARKAKKERKRTGEEVEAGSLEPSLQEMVRRLPAYRAGGKVRSVSVRLEGEEVRAVVVLGNNMVEQVRGGLGGQEELVGAGRLELMGHRSDVRCVAFSSDNTAVATGSSEAVKVWNRQSRTCVRTMPSGYCLSLAFCPGDRHLAAATKGGAVELYSLATGERTESVAAHTGEVWALVLAPDQRGFLTGGADKTVKFWDFELVAQEETGAKVLSAVHRRTFGVDEGVTALACSPDSRLFAVAMLDSTVKVFFMDSLKFFHNLYGHKLPVVSLDISGDSSLLVTASADRNIKIWGLDFGDTHKSIFAHDDTVTGVKWLPNTHYILSTGKDGEVKLWDGDTFVRIQTLSGHVGEVWTGGVSPNGKWLVSCGKDRSVRLWERTQEVLVLEDERETEREEAAEGEAGDRAAVPGAGEEVLASRRTAATEKGAEMLMEALELYAQVEREVEQGGSVSLPPLMLAYGADSALDFMCGAVTRLKSAELEETLLVLPLDCVQQLVGVLARLLAEAREVEVVARCLLFLLEIHHGPIVASGSLEAVLGEVDVSLAREVGGLRDRLGTNLAGLRHLQDRLEEQKGVEMFTDATTRQRERNKKKKNKEKAMQRAVMAL